MLKCKIKIICLLLAVLFLSSSSFAQTILVIPQGFNTSGTSLNSKILFHPDSLVVLSWNRNINSANVKIKIGTTSGNYNLTNSFFPMNAKGVNLGNNVFNQGFKGRSSGLSTGRYYGILTNSTSNNLNDIKKDVGKEYSNEFQFVITATSGAVAKNPIGTIVTSTPTFQWSSVPGVVSYWILLSSTPFEVKTDANGNLKIEGANLIWNYTTNNTSAQYGDINLLNPYDNGIPAPLLPGETYNYVILNLYEANNPIFGSSVISGINSFVYENDQSKLPVPDLISPANNSTFDNEGTITFTWKEVDWAVNYSFNLFERVTSFGGNEQTIDIPIFSAITSNNLIDFEAQSKLNKGTYVWFIIPMGVQGAGSVSETFEFFYNKSLGVFRLEAFSTLNNTGLLNYQGRAIAITEGVTPTNPYLVSNAQTFVDSIAIGTYQFIGNKVGFKDTTLTIVITKNATLKNPKIIRFPFEPFPSSLSGKVIAKNTNLPLANALVEIINRVTDEKKSVLTSSNGIYSLSTTVGQYTLRVSKAGYISADEQVLNATSGQINIPTIFIVKDEVSVSGKISNNLGQPIQLATIIATKGNTTQQSNSSGDGSYSFILSSGDWKIEAGKTGFISPTPLSLRLTTNDNLQNKNFVLIPRANQVSGIVSKVIKNSDGTTSKIPFGDISIVAEPTIGGAVTKKTNSTGWFSFSLAQGTYKFSVSKNGYTASNPIQLTLGFGQTLDNLKFDLTPNPSSVTGKITTSSGVAVDGVKIEILGVASTTSDLNGLYTLSIPNGTHQLTVSKTGYIAPLPQTLSIEPGGKLSGINFVLSLNAGGISGKIKSSGLALSGALVKAISGVTQLTTISDANGSYSFSVKPNTWSISASKSGFINAISKSITIGAGQQSANNDFSLVQNTATITGNVKVGESPGRSINVAIYKNTTNELVLNTVTDVNGQFSVSLEANIEYKIEVSKSGYSSSSKIAAALVPMSNTALSFTISQNPSSVSGKIISNNNIVIKDATITIYLDGNIVTTLLSNENGIYTLGLASGNYKIIAKKVGYFSDSSDVSLTVGQNLQNIDLTLKENFATIAGSILSDGSGLPDVLVNLISPNGGKTKFTLSDGTFLVNQLIGSNYQISFSKTGYSDTTITNFIIKDGESKTINLSLDLLNGKISGKVLTVAGTPVKGVSIKAISDLGNENISSSDENGEYIIPSLKSGNYKVSALKTNFRTSLVVNVTISPSNLDALADITDLRENIAEVSGTVKDNSNSAPLTGATVQLISKEDSYSTFSNNLGEYKLSNIAPGNYLLTTTLDNYSTVSRGVVVVENTAIISEDFVLIKISGSIVGKVVNQLGEVLKISASVEASSKSNSYIIQTENEGVFAFTEVPPDTYRVKTDIYSEGYINGEVTNVIVTPNTQKNIGNITVNVNKSKIIGNVGASNATITLLDNNGNVIKIKQSSSTGDYSFNYLANGSYVVKPAKDGYGFTPASTSVTIGINEEKIINFNAVTRIGDIVVSVKDENGQPLTQVDISIVNADTNYVKIGTTNYSGISEFLNIPSDTYIITPSLVDYTATPINQIKTLNNSDSINVSFILTKNTAQISGTIYKLVSTGTNTPLGKVTISAKSKALGDVITGEVYRALSDSITGKYLIENLPKDEFTITASRIGFESKSVYQNLKANESVTQDFILTPSIVSLKGKVVSKNIKDVNKLTLKAVSSYGEFYSSTNTAGNYSFSELPISPTENDTTFYQISLVGENSSSLTKLLKIPSQKINSTISVPDFLLPSGLLQFTITDYAEPLSGVTITLLKPNGTRLTKTTETSGVFSTDTNLFAGKYNLNLTKNEYLTPDNSSLNFILDSDTSSILATVNMPFRFIPISEVLADAKTVVSVFYKSNVNNENVKGTLFYKTASQSAFTKVDMVKGDTSLVAEIPALNVLEEISYYSQVEFLGIKYSSAEYKITPLAAGILKSISLTPELNSTVLRAGDNYSIKLIIRDGLQESLSDEFIGANSEGKITWNLPNEVEINIPDQNNPTEVSIIPTKAGDYSISVTAKLNGISIVSNISLSISEIDISNLSLSSPIDQLSNRASGIQFSISGSDTSSRSITLGNSLVWDVEPRASISNEDYEIFAKTGFYRPIDSTFIGNITIKAVDVISELSSETSVSMYADIYPNTSIELSDKEGAYITILPNSVNIPIQLKLNNTKIKSVKKYVTPKGEKDKYIVSDRAYSLSYDASTALPGDSLQTGGIIQLPIDVSLRFDEGKKGIAVYDSKETEWVIVAENLEKNTSLNKIANTNLAYNKLTQFGEYAIVSKNEQLGLRYLSVLPTPFSPLVAPVKIGYFLTSDTPPATMDIKIYNMNGELIKTVLENDIQFPGRYGSSSSLKEITWDGMTDGKNMARNGRYIIRLKAKDGKNEIEELIQVVLIK